MVETLVGGVLGFSLFTLTSHPKSPINKKLPAKTLTRRVHVTPAVKLELKNRFIHLHHWFIFTSLYVGAHLSEKAFLHSDVVQGFMLGSIAQGLTYEDRFMLVYHATRSKIPGKKAFVN